MTIDDISNNPGFEEKAHSPVNIKVVGVGGGGNNAINHMYRQGIKDVSFVVINTDKQALNASPVPTKVLIGPTVTRGRGAGNKPDVARAAAEESAEDIDALFNDETCMVFITAGMGGGTGTGAGPVVARIAKERGLLTIGIVTIPFLFEGEKKIIKALEGADEMSKYVDALLIINNDRLTEIYKDFDFVNAFGKADDTLSTAAQSISEIITCDGYMNLDFNDVDTTLREGGTAIISSGYGEGENRVSKAIQDALHSPLLKNRDILGSKRLLFNIYFNPKAEKAFKIEETKELTAFISQLDSEVDVIWGASFNENLGDKVKITILAAGFDVTTGTGAQTNGPKIYTAPEPVHQPQQHFEAAAATQPQPDTRQENERRIAEEYGKNRIDEYRTAQTSAKYIVLKPSQMDDDNILDTLESKPAFNRDKRIIDQVKSTGNNEQPQERYNPLNGGNNTIVF